MDKEHIRLILDSANELCLERHHITLFDKLGLHIHGTEDLATVLSSEKLDDVMSSGRIDFSKALPSIGKTIAATMLMPLGIFGTIAGLAWLLKPEQEEKVEIYRDIVKQLYSNPALYNAFKHLSQNGDNDASNEAFRLLILLGL